MSEKTENKHVTLWLQAYHDGELRGRKLEKVEAHLSACPECQAELAELAALSALLKSDPLPQLSTTPEQFVSQVGLQLSRRESFSETPKRSRSGWAWYLAPVGVLVVIGFIRIVSWTASLVSFLEELGGNSRMISSLAPSPQPSTTSELHRITSLALGWQFPFDMTLVFLIGLPLLLAGCYFLWLVLWWIHQESEEQLTQPNHAHL